MTLAREAPLSQPKPFRRRLDHPLATGASAEASRCNIGTPRNPQLALVVFVNHAGCRWLRGLRPGFRHCFVTLRDGAAWLCCDSLKDRIELSILPVAPSFDLARFYAKRGHTVLLGSTKPNLPRRPLAIAPLTCVTIAKRLLGVRAPWVLTPWQLCRLLQDPTHGFLTVGLEDLPGDVSRGLGGQLQP